MIAKQKNKKTKQTNKEFWRRPFLHRCGLRQRLHVVRFFR